MAHGFCGSLKVWREKRLKQMPVGGRIRMTCEADWRNGGWSASLFTKEVNLDARPQTC